MAGLIGTSTSATALLTSPSISSSSSSRASIRALSFNPGQSQGRRFYGGIGVPVKKGRSHFSVSNVATEISPPQQQVTVSNCLTSSKYIV
ncbi:putative magnesium chelatase [Helianthus annuus]|nr:putative magnesium chelatase [Helianthus annuus]